MGHRATFEPPASRKSKHYTPRLIIGFPLFLPAKAAHSNTRAALTSLRLVAVFFHVILNNPRTANENDMSRHSLRTIVSTGDRVSLRAKKIRSCFNDPTMRDSGFNTNVHIPMSSKSHSSTSGRLSVGLPLPEEPLKGGEMLDRCWCTVWESRKSSLSVSAARCVWTFSTACSRGIREAGRIGTSVT